MVSVPGPNAALGVRGTGCGPPGRFRIHPTESQHPITHEGVEVDELKKIVWNNATIDEIVQALSKKTPAEIAEIAAQLRAHQAASSADALPTQPQSDPPDSLDSPAQ